MVAQGDEGAVAVEAGFEVMESRGSVKVVPHVVGTAP